MSDTSTEKPLNIRNLALEMAALRRLIAADEAKVKSRKSVLARAENIMLGLLDKAGVKTATV
jgi:hypothetical protein